MVCAVDHRVDVVVIKVRTNKCTIFHNLLTRSYNAPDFLISLYEHLTFALNFHLFIIYFMKYKHTTSSSTAAVSLIIIDMSKKIKKNDFVSFTIFHFSPFVIRWFQFSHIILRYYTIYILFSPLRLTDLLLTISYCRRCCKELGTFFSYIIYSLILNC